MKEVSDGMKKNFYSEDEACNYVLHILDEDKKIALKFGLNRY